VIFKFNPHRMKPEDLLGTFVGRDELLSELLTHLRQQRGAKHPRHLFLFGPRGIGKTTMLLVLRHSILADPGLSSALDVLQFSEEERRIANMPAFAVRTLELLAQQRQDVSKDLEQARATPDKALGILTRAAARVPETQVLLLLDNFDELAVAVSGKKARSSAIKGSHSGPTLVDFLQSPHFVVVATAIQSPAKHKKDLPPKLLECFDPPIELKPIPDAMSFLRKRAEYDRRKGFLESLPRFASRIEGLNRLAGGNPRLLVFLYDCLGERPLIDLVEIVQKTVDDLTPMYQDVIDRLLNRGQAAVLEALAAHKGVATPRDLAQWTFQNEPTVRTFLADLCNVGLVARSGDYGFAPSPQKRPGAEIYRTHPPLFQIWYEMRHLNWEESLYLVHFFCLLASVGEARTQLAELRSSAVVTAPASHARLLEELVDILDPAWSSLREEHVWATLRQGGNLQDALRRLDSALQDSAALPVHRLAGLLVVRSGVRQSLGDSAGAVADLEQAERSLRQRDALESLARVLVARSRLLLSMGKGGEALEAVEGAEQQCKTFQDTTSRAIRADVLLAKAGVLQARGEQEAALDAVAQAEGLLADEEDFHLRVRAYSIRGGIHESVGRYREAEECYRRSLEGYSSAGDRSSQASSLNNLGGVYHSLGDYERARECHEKALAIREGIGDRRGQASSLGNLGNVYQSLGDYERAREYYEKSLAIEEEVGDRRGQASSLNNLGIVYQSLGDYEHAREYHEKSLAIEQEIGDPRGQAISLNNLGNVYQSLGDYERAREYNEKSLAIGQEIGDRSGQASSLGNLGIVYGSLGDYERAREYQEKSLAIRQEIGDRSGQASSLNNLGIVYRSLGDYARAREYHEKSLAIEQEIGNRRGQASSLGNLGIVYGSLGDYARAREYCEKSLAIQQEIGDRRGQASSLDNLGIVYESQGDYARAREYHEKSLAIQQEIGDRSGQASSLGSLGNVYQSLGDYARAREYFEKSLAIEQEIGDRTGQASSLNNLGIVYRSLGDYERAREYNEKSLAIGQEIGNRSGQASSLGNLGNVYQSLGDYARAREYHEKSLAIEQEIGNRHGQARSLNNLGIVYGSLGDYERAREYYEKSLAIEQEIGDRSGQASSLGNLGNVYASLGDHERAREYFEKAHTLFVALGQAPHVRMAAGNLADALFHLVGEATRHREYARAEELIGKAASFAPAAGPERVLAAFLNNVVVATLRHSRDLASRLLGFLESLSSRPEIAVCSGPLKAIRAVLLYFSSGESPSEKDLTPAELFMVVTARDRIERPLHARARELLEAGKPAEAADVLQSVLDRSPDDIEALVNLSVIRTKENRLDEAESLARRALAKQQDLFPAVSQLAEVAQKRGHVDRPIELLSDFLKNKPSEAGAYPALANALSAAGRFEELAQHLRNWRDRASDPENQERLKVWIPQADILAGQLDRAQAALPGEDFRPKKLELQLFLGAIRVLVDLHRRDGENARKHAAETLAAALDAPPGRAGRLLSDEMARRARELLDDAAWEFLVRFTEALANRADPRDFAQEMLDESQAAALVQKFVDEEKLALEFLKQGRIQGFRDLLRTSSRRIGPPAALRAFGERYAEFSGHTRSLVAGIFADAISEGNPVEVTAALHAVAENFLKLEPQMRALCLRAMLSLVARESTTPLNREQAIQLLNVLYPGLTADERVSVRQKLTEARQRADSPALLEFFGKTLPAIGNGAQS
jgi:tetratricopeptide (TPR) repeat protein